MRCEYPGMVNVDFLLPHSFKCSCIYSSHKHAMEHDPSQALQVSIVVKGRGMNPHGQLWGKTFPGWEYRMPRGLDGLSGATERGVEVEERKCQLMVCEFFLPLMLLTQLSACTVCPSYLSQEWCWAEPSSISPQCGVVQLVKVRGPCPLYQRLL